MTSSEFKRNRFILAQGRPSERLIISTDQSVLPTGFKYHYSFYGSHQDLLYLAERIASETPKASDIMSKFARMITPIVDVGSSEDVFLCGACYDSNLYLYRHLPPDLPVDRYRAPNATDAI